MPVLHKPVGPAWPADQPNGRWASARGSNEEPKRRRSLLTSILSSKARKMHFNLTLTKNISKLNELNYYLQVDQELDPYFCQHT